MNKDDKSQLFLRALAEQLRKRGIDPYKIEQSQKPKKQLYDEDSVIWQSEQTLRQHDANEDDDLIKELGIQVPGNDRDKNVDTQSLEKNEKDLNADTLLRELGIKEKNTQQGFFNMSTTKEIYQNKNLLTHELNIKDIVADAIENRIEKTLRINNDYDQLRKELGIESIVIDAVDETVNKAIESIDQNTTHEDKDENYDSLVKELGIESIVIDAVDETVSKVIKTMDQNTTQSRQEDSNMLSNELGIQSIVIDALDNAVEKAIDSTEVQTTSQSNYDTFMNELTIENLVPEAMEEPLENSIDPIHNEDYSYQSNIYSSDDIVSVLGIDKEEFVSLDLNENSHDISNQVINDLGIKESESSPKHNSHHHNRLLSQNIPQKQPLDESDHWLVSSALIQSLEFSQHPKSEDSTLVKELGINEDDSLLADLGINENRQQGEPIEESVEEPMKNSLIAELGINENNPGVENISIHKNPARVGAKLKHYKIEAKVGSGGMGFVFKAKNEKNNRVVAIKQLRSIREKAKKRFEQEYKFLKKIHHPNLIQAYAMFEEVYLHMVLEFAHGNSLQDILHEQSKLPLIDKITIANKIARGVEVINTANILHRDLKPANIMIDRKQGTVKILDLGLGKDVNSDITLNDRNEVIGTAMYLSPEQTESKSHPRSDIFSMGIVMYQLFTNSNISPFYADNPYSCYYMINSYEPPTIAEIFAKKAITPVERNVHRQLSDIVAKAMKKNPLERWENAGMVAEQLANIYKAFLPHAPSPGQFKITPKLNANLRKTLTEISIPTIQDRQLLREHANPKSVKVYPKIHLLEPQPLKMQPSTPIQPNEQNNTPQDKFACQALPTKKLMVDNIENFNHAKDHGKILKNTTNHNVLSDSVLQHHKQLRQTRRLQINKQKHRRMHTLLFALVGITIFGIILCIYLLLTTI